MAWYGFNFQWMFAHQGNPPQEADERALYFLAAYGFDFVRIPCDYNFWTTNFNYFEPDEVVFAYLDRCVSGARLSHEPEPAPRAGILHQPQ